MPKKLIPDEIERRRRESAQARELLMVERWKSRRDDAELLIAETPAFLEQRDALTPRHLWLLLGVTETDETEHLVRKRGKSSHTKWFDRIAPRARRDAYGLDRGVTGFTTRIGAELKDLVSLSRNGYVYSTTRGLAVVEYFRSLYPELQLKNAAKFNCSQPLEVAGFMTVPNLRWRSWED